MQEKEKEVFETPEIEIVRFPKEDIVTASSGGAGSAGGGGGIVLPDDEW